MRLFFWVTALAVLSLSHAKNKTENSKPKRQLENIRTPQNLQYSLVLPNSRVTHFRSLGGPSRRISNVSPRGNLPPYAVQMEPVVQYSQKDPLYDPSLENRDEVVDKNELYAQPKIIHGLDQTPEGTYGAHYGSLPTAPLYSHEPHPHYYEAPEPIIEIIIKESNETLPPPPPQPILKKKKEPVQVFYVKYSKDPYAKDKVVYDKPVPAVTPPTNDHDEHEHDHQDYVTVTPEPYYESPPTTTLRAIIKPDSEVYHSDSTVKVTFGNEGHHRFYSDRREGNANTEEREETAPRPAIAYPQQQEVHPPLERSAKPNNQIPENYPRPQQSNTGHQNYKPIQGSPQYAQNRIQYQQQFVGNEQQLPRQGSSISQFRGHVARQNPFPNPGGPNPTFANQLPGPINHFANNQPPAGPLGPIFSASQPRPGNAPSFHPRPNSQPPFAPRPHINGPPRNSFHSGPQRPFHPPQSQQFFDETKYLQENYHTITSEHLEPSKDQPLPNKPNPNLNFVPKPNPGQFEDSRKPHVPLTQQLPQQRPHQQFIESSHNRPTFAISPNRPPFFNLKPSPPHIEESRIPFQQPQPQQPPFSFHQGIQSISRPAPATQNQNNAQRFPGPISPSPSPNIFPSSQFLPQPSSPPHFNYHAHLPSPSPSGVPNHFPLGGPSERPPQFQQFNNPSERPDLQNENFNAHRQHGVGQFVPNGGELVAAIPKYEQHITVSGPSAQVDYSGLGQQGPSAAAANHAEKQYRQQQEQQYQQQKQQQNEQHQRQQHQQQLQQQEQQQQQEQRQRQLQQQKQQEQHQLQQQQQQQQIYDQHQQQQQQQQQQQRQQQFDAEQEQLRQQLAENVQKQQAEIQRLQSQLLQAQNQQIHESQQFQSQHIQATSPQPQYSQERSRPIKYALSQQSFPSSSSQPYYQSTSRTVEIKPTTQKYRSSTLNSINPTPEPKKEQKKNKPSIELPDEVPDDLRQQLLSSGILDNADISVLDYDKVGDTPLDSLPPDQLANFFSAGGGQQIAASENRPIVVAPTGENIQPRIDEEDDDDQDIAASETIANYEAPPSETKQAVEMKVVHFNPDTADGRKLAKDYVQDDATRLDPVALNDKKYNRYLPLKVSGNQFPLPDVLKGRKVTSVVVLAPVETEVLNTEHTRTKRAVHNLKGIKFIAGDSLQDLLKKPTRENFEKWLKIEKNTAADLQSVVLLVTGTEDESADKEIYMYDISSGKVNKLNGDLSNAFVEAAENNALSRDIEKLAIEGEGTPENFQKPEEDSVADGSDNVPFLVDLSGLSLEQDNQQVSISSSYSKTKLGRSLRKH